MVHNESKMGRIIFTKRWTGRVHLGTMWSVDGVGVVMSIWLGCG